MTPRSGLVNNSLSPVGSCDPGVDTARLPLMPCLPLDSVKPCQGGRTQLPKGNVDRSM